MLRNLYIFFSIGIIAYAGAQNPCINQFIHDSLTKPGETSPVVVNALTYTLKNGGAIQFIKDNNKLFLRIKTNEKLGFVPDGTLELVSGSKSIFFKTVLCNINKANAYFIVPIGINYVATLKDYGLTAMVFNSHEVKFIKEEIKGVKETANCFYTINNKK